MEELEESGEEPEAWDGSSPRVSELEVAQGNSSMSEGTDLVA